jgi:hypothetical protein
MPLHRRRNTWPSLLHHSLAFLAFCAFAAAAAAASPFDGKDVTVTWEYWSGGSPGAGGSHVATTDTVVVEGDDVVDPDLPDFHGSTGNDFELWDVDFWQDEIRLGYTSIHVQDFDHQYMYLSPVGFHFEDVADTIGDIQDVQVDASIAPFGFDPALVTFDANNIWVDLAGSMCHFGSMGSMPSCTNPASPTGYDNEIALIVTVPEPGLAPSLSAGLGLLFVLHRRRRRSTGRG